MSRRATPRSGSHTVACADSKRWPNGLMTGTGALDFSLFGSPVSPFQIERTTCNSPSSVILPSETFDLAATKSAVRGYGENRRRWLRQATQEVQNFLKSVRVGFRSRSRIVWYAHALFAGFSPSKKPKRFASWKNAADEADTLQTALRKRAIAGDEV